MSERVRIQRKKADDGEREVAPPIVHEALRSGGEPLDAETRAFMEPRFGFDFGGVRVHTDETAVQSAEAVNALAYTAGHDVVFGARQYQPGTEVGRQLIAHELAHVVQFSLAGSAPDFSRISPRNHPSESEARTASANYYHSQPTVQPEGLALQEQFSAQSQTVNDLDPRNPRNYATFEAFAQGYQEAEQRSIPEEELRRIWNEAHPQGDIIIPETTIAVSRGYGLAYQIGKIEGSQGFPEHRVMLVDNKELLEGYDEGYAEGVKEYWAKLSNPPQEGPAFEPLSAEKLEEDKRKMEYIELLGENWKEWSQENPQEWPQMPTVVMGK